MLRDAPRDRFVVRRSIQLSYGRVARNALYWLAFPRSTAFRRRWRPSGGAPAIGYPCDPTSGRGCPEYRLRRLLAGAVCAIFRVGGGRCTVNCVVLMES